MAAGLRANMWVSSQKTTVALRQLWRGIPAENSWPVRANSSFYQFRKGRVNKQKSLSFANDRIRVKETNFGHIGWPTSVRMETSAVPLNRETADVLWDCVVLLREYYFTWNWTVCNTGSIPAVK